MSSITISRVYLFDLTYRIQGCGCIIVVFTSSLAWGGGCAVVTILFISILTSIGHACGRFSPGLSPGSGPSASTHSPPKTDPEAPVEVGLQVGFR